MSEPSEVTVSYNKFQYSTFVNGDQIVVRADTAEELTALVVALGENTEDFLKALNGVKKAHVASGVFTGDSAKKGATTTRKADTPPPKSDGGAPTCDHGPMKDLGGKGYKHRYYCPAPRGQRQCSAQD